MTWITNKLNGLKDEKYKYCFCFALFMMVPPTPIRTRSLNVWFGFMNVNRLSIIDCYFSRFQFAFGIWCFAFCQFSYDIGSFSVPQTTWQKRTNVIPYWNGYERPLNEWWLNRLYNCNVQIKHHFFPSSFHSIGEMGTIRHLTHTHT